MSMSAEQQQRLSQLLTAELDICQRLLEILKQEQQLLSGLDTEKITAISAEKMARLKELETPLKERQALLDALDIEHGVKGDEQLTELLSNNPPVADQWRKLQALAVELQRQNEVNGSIAVKTQRHISTALDILTGRKESATKTYGRSGETSSDNRSQRLAKA